MTSTQTQTESPLLLARRHDARDLAAWREREVAAMAERPEPDHIIALAWQVGRRDAVIAEYERLVTRLLTDIERLEAERAVEVGVEW